MGQAEQDCHNMTSRTHGIICETPEHVKFATDFTDSCVCGIVVSKSDSIKDITKYRSECQNVNNAIECSMELRIAVVFNSVDSMSLFDIVYGGTMYVNRLQITRTVHVGTCRLDRAEKHCGYTVSVITLNEQ
jgi:hypothetical protein